MAPLLYCALTRIFRSHADYAHIRNVPPMIQIVPSEALPGEPPFESPSESPFEAPLSTTAPSTHATRASPPLE